MLWLLCFFACCIFFFLFFFFSSRRRHTRLVSDWSSDVCSSDLASDLPLPVSRRRFARRSRSANGTPLASPRSEEHTSELQSLTNLVCRLLLEKKKKKQETLLVTKLYLR